MTRKTTLKQAVYRRPLPGRHWILLGGLMMFIWAFWEGMVRIDAMDGMVKAYFSLARSQGTSFLEAARVIWQTPDARKDWLNVVYLALIALTALLAMIVHRRWKPGFLLIPLSAAVFLFHTSQLPLVQVLNLFEALKAFSCGLLALGEGMNIVSALDRRRRAARQIAAQEQRSARLSHGTAKTLIPERKNRGANSHAQR